MELKAIKGVVLERNIEAKEDKKGSGKKVTVSWLTGVEITSRKEARVNSKVVDTIVMKKSAGGSPEARIICNFVSSQFELRS